MRRRQFGNRMFGKDNFDEALRRYVPATIYERIRQNGKAALEPWSEEIEAFVYTQDRPRLEFLEVHVGPPVYLVFLNHYQAIMHDIITNYGGIVVDMNAGFVQAYWDGSAGAGDVCRAARSAEQRCRQLSLDAFGADVLPIAIGLTRGRIALSNTGGAHRLKLHLVGGAANFSRRLADSALHYSVRTILDENVRAAATGEIAARELDYLNVLGSMHPARIYELMAV